MCVLNRVHKKTCSFLLAYISVALASAAFARFRFIAEAFAIASTERARARAVATFASAQELKVGLASEPTSMDPHYHNQTANNSLASQVYDALTLQDVNQKLIPGLAA